MNWIVVVGGVVIVLLLVVLFMPSHKGTEKGRHKEKAEPPTGDLSERQRATWARAEEAVAEFRDARGHQVGPARERMLRVADEVDAGVVALETAGASQRQVRMSQLAASEIRGFVNDALAAHPGGQEA